MMYPEIYDPDGRTTGGSLESLAADFDVY